MDYSEEQDKALTLAVEVGEMVSILRDLHEQYPLLVKAVFAVLYGTVVHASGDCSHCRKPLTIKADSPVGGLIDACEAVDDALVMLGFEEKLAEVDQQ